MANLPRSPVLSVLDNVPASLARIAPERADDIRRMLDGVSFRFTDDQGFDFKARPHSKEILVPIRGVEYIWVLAYTHWVLHRHYAAGEHKPFFVQFSSHSDTAPLPLLLPWAFANQIPGREYEPWPDNTPRPNPSVGNTRDSTDEEIATELALCAIAWILHHELAHIVLNHPIPSPTFLQDEQEADDKATNWILDLAPPGYPTIKRGLGIATATVGIAGFELFVSASSSTPRTYPHPADRIARALEHPTLAEAPVVQFVAAIALKLQLDHHRVTIEQDDFPTPADCLNEYCYALRRFLP